MEQKDLNRLVEVMAFINDDLVNNTLTVLKKQSKIFYIKTRYLS